MLRYIALSWNIEQPESVEAAQRISEYRKIALPSWETSVSQPGLLLYSVDEGPRPQAPLRLASGCGAIIGTIFEGSSPACSLAATATPSLVSRLTTKLLQTNGHCIVDDHWGSYVLFLRNTQQRALYVLRSPMSRLACFRANYRGLNLFFSSVEDITSLRLLSFSINWDCIRAQAASGDFLTQETALDGITSVECGECVTIRPDRTDLGVYWSPGDVARKGTIGNFHAASIQLRKSTQLCVDAWSSHHENVLHTLSGGIDSSIVLSCLNRAPNRPQITCVNWYSKHTHGDERRFARSMAGKFGNELIEVERNPRVDLRVFLTCALTARPVLAYSACDSHSTSARLARERNASGIFDGELGDHVFGAVRGHEAVTEYVWRNGLIDAGVIPVAADYAYLRRISIWPTLYRSMRDARRWPKISSWSVHRYLSTAIGYDPRERSLVSAQALEDYRRHLDRFIHPWLRNVHDIPPSKMLLICALAVVTSTSYHAPFYSKGEAPTVSPLVSQPLVEVALGVAGHLNIRNGCDRAIARHAFSNDLSEIVLNRGGKGTPGMWIRELVEHNRPFLRDTLLQGILVKERILDPVRVEAALSEKVSNSAVMVTDLIAKLYMEAWARRWVEQRTQLAA